MKKKYKKYLPLILGKYIQALFIFNQKKALNKAYLLFCTPRKGKVLPEQEVFLENAEDEIITVDNLHLQTYRWPSLGETILLVHGWESNTHRWKNLIEKLHQQGYNVVAFDAPAHGNSSGKILNVPLYTQCLQKIIDLYRPNYLLGHSVGGMATIFHQYTQPNDEIDKLIVLAPPSELARIMDGYQNTLKLSAKFMDALNQFFKNKHGYYFEEFSMASFAKNLHKKGLLIHDIYDPIAPFSEAENIYKNWKEVQFIKTENLGHSLFYDQVDHWIIEFLNQ